MRSEGVRRSVGDFSLFSSTKMPIGAYIKTSASSGSIRAATCCIIVSGDME